MKKILLFLAVASSTALAQITITNSDLANMFTVGNTIIVHEDTLVSSINIGSPGGGNNWDFTVLQSNLMIDLEIVNAAGTPYIADFPGATICTYSTGLSNGEQAEIWAYLSLNGTFDLLGNAITVSSQPGVVTQIKNNPPRRQFEPPVTLNSQWMQTYTQSLVLNGLPLFSSNVSLSSVVDAFGSMTLPGGATMDALRIREGMTISGATSVSFTFIARNGTQVNVSAVDANPPGSGIINIEDASYNGSFTTTGIEQVSSLPENFRLSQNYPNPFNPSTSIEYSIPEQSFVELKVYDVLGNEVASLVNQDQSAGSYRVDFSGTGLTSGTYFYRLQASGFIETAKMILLK